MIITTIYRWSIETRDSFDTFFQLEMFWNMQLMIIYIYTWCVYTLMDIINIRRMFVLCVTGAGIGIRRTRAGSYHWTMVLRRTAYRRSDTKYRTKLANVLLQNPPRTDSGFPRVNFWNVNFPPAIFLGIFETRTQKLLLAFSFLRSMLLQLFDSKTSGHRAGKSNAKRSFARSVEKTWIQSEIWKHADWFSGIRARCWSR